MMASVQEEIYQALLIRRVQVSPEVLNNVEIKQMNSKSRSCENEKG